jgi:ferric-dicitrate binding protein FerR (iron transport regulator)
VEVDEYIAWQSGWFRFNDKPMSQIMVTLARWYDLEVQFESENISNKHFSGGFKRYDSFDQARKIIEQTEEIKFEVKGKKVIIL